MNKFKFDIQKNNLSWEKTHYKKCDSPKCNQKGEYRAPKSRVMLNKYFDHDLPSSEASTISGHILNLAKRIPLYGEAVKDEYFIYKILSHSRKQISKIEITPIR